MKSKVKVFETVIQYKYYFEHDEKEVCFEGENFICFLNIIQDFIYKKGVLKIQILASASQTPTTVYKNNTILSLQRATICKELFLNLLIESGFRRESFIFTPFNTIVQKTELNNLKSIKRNQYVLITCY